MIAMKPTTVPTAARAGLNYTRADFDHSPMIVFYEMTRACDLACKHCRANAQKRCHPDELTAGEAARLIQQLTVFSKPPLLVLTGGDPLKRADVFDLVDDARARGLTVAMTPSATPRVTTNAVNRLQRAGLHRLAVSLDGADADTHDGFRGVAGSFDCTFRILADARACGLPCQVNTTITRHNVGQVDAMAELLAKERIVLWSVFFLIPTGRATADQRISPHEYEQVFDKLATHTRCQPYGIKTTEAPQYRRFLLQRYALEPKPLDAENVPGTTSPKYIGTNDGKGVMFISHTGEIYPSGFLPIRCGQFPFDSVVRVYQDSAVFRALRDGDRLVGKCRACDFRHICGGSRARAYAVTGNPLAAEPDCTYIPPTWNRSTESELVNA